jgi:phosphatidylserine/phosphatidylglycerophosphate/cardiolipin synthase-like enzyme
MKKFIFLFLVIFSFQKVKAEDHQIIVCENSLEMIQWAHKLIGHAEQSIEFSPCFFGGQLLHEMLGTIEAKLKTHPKLKVSLIMSMAFLEPSDIELVTRLQKQYFRQFHVSFTSSVITIGQDLVAVDNHVKMLVVDEQYFIVGGTNYDYSICSEGTTTPKKRIKDCLIGSKLSSGARDQDVIGKGCVAKELRYHFYLLSALWDDYNKSKKLASADPYFYASKSRIWDLDETKKRPLQAFDSFQDKVSLADHHIQMILGSPTDSPNKITKAYCDLINSAEKEIWIGNLHYAPVDPIAKALMQAVKRGVKVHVISNGVHDNSPESTRFISLPNRLYYIPTFYGRTFGFFDKSKCQKMPVGAVKIYEYNVFDILYHKKVMIVDNHTFVVGSYNLGFRSDNSDHELIMIIQNSEVAHKARTILQRDILFSREVTPQMARDWYFDPILNYQAEVQRKLNNFF